MRSSSDEPSSNSWLPTVLMSTPIALNASIVGSSWKSPESSGLAPMLSPPLTTSVLRFLARSFLMCVARYSAPPAAGLLSGNVSVPGGARLPWKSLKLSS